jgi:hypothetical protein
MMAALTNRVITDEMVLVQVVGHRAVPVVGGFGVARPLLDERAA